MSTSVEFRAYGRPLVMVTEFKYLRQVLTALDDYFPEVMVDIRKVRSRRVLQGRLRTKYDWIGTLLLGETPPDSPLP